MAPGGVFTMWEPPDAAPAYIRLCLRTWRPHLGDVTVIDHSNAVRYTGDALDLAALRRYPLIVQKDAIEAAVLHRHGGVFMDADTIVLRDLAPVLAHLQRSELVLFNVYLGFAAARAGSAILASHLAEIQRRLARAEDCDRWSYLGNEPLAAVLDQLIDDAPLVRLTPLRFVRGYRDVPPPEREARAARAVRRSREILYRRLRRAVLRLACRRRLTTLDRIEWGFIPEERQFPGRTKSAPEKYERFWFGDDVPLERAFSSKQCVIALHNSWTPQWYAQMSEEEVLAHPCLLSRTLKHLLGGVMKDEG